jgi:hypothetical protein
VKAAPGKRDEFWDDRVPGFGVRVTDRGAKSYVLYTRWPGTGNPARRALGSAEKLTLEAARKIAKKWVNLIEQGIDPQEQENENRLELQRRRRTTFEVVAEDWLREAVLGHQRKADEVARDVRRVFVARWKGRPVAEISALDVRDIIRSVRDAGARAQARNLLGYVKRLFGWAVGQDAYGIVESPAERLRPKDIVGKKVVRRGRAAAFHHPRY